MKLVWQILLVLCMTFIGLAGGTWVGALFFVPAGQGFAAGPGALVYGLMGAAVLFALGLMINKQQKDTTIRNAAIVSVLVTLVVIGILSFRLNS